jgi:AcrR family transcriptional regulator
MSATTNTNGRIWGGTTLDKRQLERREQLLAAGYTLLGEQGAAAVTVRGVTRTAKLSERYFYESFKNRDELLLVVHDRIAEQARGVITAAIAALAGDERTSPQTIATAGLTAFTDFLEQDRRRGRVLLQEAFANEVLVRRGVELLPSFALLVVEQISANFEGLDETDSTLSAVAIVGALAHLYLGWIDGSIAVSRERLIDHATGLILGAAAVHSRATTTNALGYDPRASATS